MTTTPEKPNTLMFLKEAADMLRLPESTLRYWRHMNKGPKAARIGGRVMYRKSDVENWIEEQFDNA